MCQAYDMSARRRIKITQGRAALEAWLAAQADGATPVDRATTATAVRFTLEELAARAPGQALEVRVPPFGATQCIAGPTHRRGTPPAVVEVSPDVWLGLVTGRIGWGSAVAAGDVDASGERSDLSAHIPLTDW